MHVYQPMNNISSFGIRLHTTSLNPSPTLIFTLVFYHRNLLFFITEITQKKALQRYDITTRKVAQADIESVNDLKLEVIFAGSDRCLCSS